jgi:hypothetical protein
MKSYHERKVVYLPLGIWCQSPKIRLNAYHNFQIYNVGRVVFDASLLEIITRRAEKCVDAKIAIDKVHVRLWIDRRQFS